MSIEERVENYNKTLGTRFPASRLHYQGNFITGIWMIGACYKNNTDYYGAYPHGYLERMTKLFPEDEHVLHLFSGSLANQGIKATTFDINKELNPTISGDAHKLSEIFGSNCFDVIFADPPYSGEDALHYGTPMVNRNTVLKECVKILKPNGFLVWLDQVYPMYRKAELKLVGTIGLIRSTNHRVRTVFIYQKVCD